MPNAEKRDATVAAVHAAHEKWPSLDAMPDAPEPAEDVRYIFVEVENDDAGYVRALHELAHKGATPVGRVPGKSQIVGSVPT